MIQPDVHRIKDLTDALVRCRQQLAETEIDSLAAAARKQAGVSVHQATVQRILGDAQQ